MCDEYTQVHSIILNAMKCKCMAAASTSCRNLVVSDSNCRFFGLPTDFLDISTHIEDDIIIHSYKHR